MGTPELHYTECCNAECHALFIAMLIVIIRYAECHALFIAMMIVIIRYAECHVLFISVLIVIILNVVMLSVMGLFILINRLLRLAKDQPTSLFVCSSVSAEQKKVL
jgi:hypothetical protein